MNFYSDMKSILTSINEAIPDMPWLSKVRFPNMRSANPYVASKGDIEMIKEADEKPKLGSLIGKSHLDSFTTPVGPSKDYYYKCNDCGFTYDWESATGKCPRCVGKVTKRKAPAEEAIVSPASGPHVGGEGDPYADLPIVGKAPIADPTSDIPVKYLNTLGNTIFISVSGHKYGYSPIDDRTPDHLVRSFRGMLRYSPWKALNWLSKNAKLVSGSEKGVPTVARGISTYEKADYVCHINDLVEYLLDGMSINEVLEVTDYLTEQVAMIHPQIKSMNDLIRETMLMLNNKDLIGHVKSMDDYPDYSVLYIDAGADKAKMTEFVQDLGWISQESKLVLTPLDETEEDIPVDEVSNKQWVFLLSFDKLPEHIIAKIRTGGDKQRVMLNTQSLPAPSVPPEAPAEGEVDITT